MNLAFAYLLTVNKPKNITVYLGMDMEEVKKKKSKANFMHRMKQPLEFRSVMRGIRRYEIQTVHFIQKRIPLINKWYYKIVVTAWLK